MSYPATSAVVMSHLARLDFGWITPTSVVKEVA